MINNLTEEQKKLFTKMIAKTRDSYINNLAFQDKVIAKETVLAIYKRLNKKKPIIIFAKNPLELAIKAALLKVLFKNKNTSAFGGELYRELGRELDRELHGELHRELGRELYGELHRELHRELGRVKLKFYNGLSWRYSTTFYRFGERIGIHFNTCKLDLLENFAIHCPIVAPYENFCFVCENPQKVYFLNQRLHKDGGSCIEWNYTKREIYKIYRLNGTRVPQWLAETPSAQLKPEQYLEIKDIDVKAQFIKKFGVDRMVSIGKTIDVYENHKNSHNYKFYSDSEYKLVDMSVLFPERYNYLPYLYMKNQTVPGLYHLECVYNPKLKEQPKTITEALQVRMGGINPENTSILFIK